MPHCLRVAGDGVVRLCPLITLASHLPCSGTGRWRRRISSAFTDFSLAVIFFLSVIRWTQNRPCLVIRAMCRNPRNVNVSGFPSPRAFRTRAACGPNSISRVLSGCSSRLNFASLPRSSPRNLSASSWYWNPTMKSSANRVTMTFPRACVFLQRSAHRSRT